MMTTQRNWKFYWRTTCTLLLTLCLLTPAAWSQGLEDSGRRAIDVATINLYVGADFAPVLSLDPSDPDFGVKLLGGVATIYSHIRQSNFEVRADALAKEIARRRPDVVALQEVTLLRRQSPGDAIAGGLTPATTVELDYLEILMAALHRYGGHYKVVSQVQDIDVEVPLVTGLNTFDDLRLTDRDVILARTDLPPGHLYTYNPQQGNFGVQLPLPIGVTVLRGWASIDVQIRGRNLRFINTHLEDRLPEGLPNIQMAQAFELLQGPARTTLPVVLAGDFNSDANGNYSSETYALLTSQGGFADLWNVAGGSSLGLTWGHDQFLSDFTVPFSLRLDLILYRGDGLRASDGVVVDPVIGTVVPFWFSDHAALFGRLAIE